MQAKTKPKQDKTRSIDNDFVRLVLHVVGVDNGYWRALAATLEMTYLCYVFERCSSPVKSVDILLKRESA